MPNPVLCEGQRAPAFTLSSTQGSYLRLTEQRGLWLVLYFYPKDHSSTCTMQACDFRDLYSNFLKERACIIGIGPDNLSSHLQFSKQNQLPFPLLEDRGWKVAMRYGAWREKRRSGRAFLGFVRSTFVVDPSGKIMRLFDQVRVHGHARKVLQAVREAKSRP